MAVTDIRHFGASLELVDHPVEGWQPCRREIRLVARPEELLDAVEHPVMSALSAHLDCDGARREHMGGSRRRSSRLRQDEARTLLRDRVGGAAGRLSAVEAVMPDRVAVSHTHTPQEGLMGDASSRERFLDGLSYWLAHTFSLVLGVGATLVALPIAWGVILWLITWPLSGFAGVADTLASWQTPEVRSSSDRFWFF
jgi:hypothetical protein